jgi:hypothetical protein
MGLTIEWHHRTKDLEKIKKLIQDLKSYAETVGKDFSIYERVGYSRSTRSETHMLDGSIEVRGNGPTDFMFETDKSREYSGAPPIIPSREIGFKIEVRDPNNHSNSTMLQVGWHLRNGYWIAYDWTKLFGPDGDEEGVVPLVIGVDGILEYIKKYYFPNFVIRDDFDFYVNYDDVSPENKKFWKDIIEGKRPAYKLADGTYPDYDAQYRAKKNHDINNIYKAIGSIKKVFGKIEGKLAEVGYGEEDIERNVPVRPVADDKGISLSSTVIGDQIVERLHNSIRASTVIVKRPRIMQVPTRRLPVTRVLLRRKDGVPQHYHKRLGGPK